MTVQFTARLDEQLHRILKRLSADSSSSINAELNRYLKMGLMLEAKRRKRAQGKV